MGNWTQAILNSLSMSNLQSMASTHLRGQKCKTKKEFIAKLLAKQESDIHVHSDSDEEKKVNSKDDAPSKRRAAATMNNSKVTCDNCQKVNIVVDPQHKFCDECAHKLPLPGGEDLWTCSQCGRSHSTSACGFCGIMRGTNTSISVSHPLTEQSSSSSSSFLQSTIADPEANLRRIYNINAISAAKSDKYLPLKEYRSLQMGESAATEFQINLSDSVHLVHRQGKTSPEISTFSDFSHCLLDWAQCYKVFHSAWTDQVDDSIRSAIESHQMCQDLPTVLGYVEGERRANIGANSPSWGALSQEAAVKFIVRLGSTLARRNGQPQAPRSGRSKRTPSEPSRSERIMPDDMYQKCKSQSLCIKFNKGKCSERGPHRIGDARVKHVCAGCGEGHGYVDCPKKH